MGFRFGPDATVDQVHHALDEHGVAVVEDFLTPALVQSLRDEVARLLAGEPLPGMKQQFDEVFTRSRKIDFHGFDWGAYPGVRAAVDDPRVAQVMAYREYESEQFPEYIIAQRSQGRFDEAESLPPQFAMHTDGIQAHRFMFYLSDVGEDDGPLTIVPGAYRKYKEWRDRQRDKGRAAGRRYRLVPDLEEQGQKMTGRAGTLVTFFTDSPHKAGIVAAGRERVIFRINAGAFVVKAPSVGARLGRSMRRLLGGEDIET